MEVSHVALMERGLRADPSPHLLRRVSALHLDARPDTLQGAQQVALVRQDRESCAALALGRVGA